MNWVVEFYRDIKGMEANSYERKNPERTY